tara:strand:+ start:260 stop:430 length:171 start_codon:yes stop_codon:yes gene_type:complete
MKTIFKEIQNDMEDFFEEMDKVIYTYEVDGEVVSEPVEDVLEREQLEMEAELAMGI